MNKSGLQNEEFLQKIQREGSTALSSRNSFGINVFSGSVLEDGVVSGQLTKTKYNSEELVKSIDTNIFELIPAPIPPQPDVVPRPIYNDALSRISELEIDIENLNVEISDLTAIVSELTVTNQSLRIELDAKDLLVASVENQNQQNIQQTQNSIFDLQNSIQRATSEAIERTSIDAVNQSLLSQIDGLFAQIEGLNAQIGGLNTTISGLNDRIIQTENKLSDTQNQLAIQQEIAQEQQAEGAFSNNEITATPDVNDYNNPSITWRGRPRNDFSNGKFINGGTITLTNPQDKSVSVSVKTSGFDNQPVFGTIPAFTIPSKGTYTLKLNALKSKIDKLKSGKDSRHPGELIFSSPSGGTFKIDAEIQIQRGPKFFNE